MSAPASTARNVDGLYAIVLAAGASTRFGSAKQLVRVAGRPLLHTAVTRAAEVTGTALIVVLGSGAAQLAPLLKHTAASIVINQEWREGLASSIRAGVARLPAACSAVLLLLADQAAVTADDLRRLAGSWRKQPHHIAAALYGGFCGAPAIFPRSSFRALSELRGDTGARGLLTRNADRVVRVPMPSAAVDVDTPEDLLALEGPK
ncbi:MAG: nucleotidyltransferase family protein [Gammaproteobacteria bacterium]|nr:nucleotidyltransferase family protein [Gammaproteobacteria bacterium]MBV8308396.1 nucleotidyltransferase family protein [Gammaproteobacteria bacterium]MBV8405598.1 nucleotidyltransferase family protein [Gammaproteobacteria bacterium]